MWKKFSRTQIYWPYRGGGLSRLSLDPVSSKSMDMIFLHLSLHLQRKIWCCLAYFQAWFQNRHSEGRTWKFFYTHILTVLPFFPIHLQRNWLHYKVCCINGENVFFFLTTGVMTTWNTDQQCITKYYNCSPQQASLFDPYVRFCSPVLLSLKYTSPVPPLCILTLYCQCQTPL